MYCKPIYKVKWKTQVRRRKFHVKAKIIDELIKKEEYSNDALHMAIIKRGEIDNVATNDPDSFMIAG
jgi:predicted nucleic acid-binding protein